MFTPYSEELDLVDEAVERAILFLFLDLLAGEQDGIFLSLLLELELALKLDDGALSQTQLLLELLLIAILQLIVKLDADVDLPELLVVCLL